MKKNDLLLSIFLIFIIIDIIISPSRFISAGLNGISAWAFNVLPSVLPFMILTRLLNELGLIEKICIPFSKIMKKLFGTGSISSYVFFMSVLSGYPVGSKMIADLYESGKITNTEAIRMSSFCSNSGPMFIVGSVGVGMLLNPICGYIILISHIFSAILNGIIYRKITSNKFVDIKFPMEKSETTFGDIILSSTQAILNVGSIITFFFIIIESINPIFNVIPSPLSQILSGLIEMTKGCIEVSKVPISKIYLTSICSFLITFGGLSTILQSITLLKRVKMKISLFTLQKFTQSLLAFLISLILSVIIF